MSSWVLEFFTPAPQTITGFDDWLQGVVSEKLKVHGIDNLWVVDASVMPNITSGNINAPVMMLSHLSSKIILEELKQQYQWR